MKFDENSYKLKQFKIDAIHVSTCMLLLSEW